MLRLVSMSGGKDSVALWLWARRTGLEPRAVFCDTGWEAPQTYDYLRYLEEVVGPIVKLTSEGFAERTVRGGTFPSRVRKWCSPELKVEPFAAYVATLDDDCEVLVGMRREESPDRAALSEREWQKDYDCEVWRPILDWTLADVIAEHHRAGVALNPLYLLGAERVGCWPCIHARKSELRIISEIDPARIERVAAVEKEVGQTMFALEASRAGGAERKLIPTGIHGVVAWSKTKRGGKKLAVIPEPSGCAKWGICDAPVPADDDDDCGS